MTAELSPDQTRILVLSELLLNELIGSREGPLQYRLEELLNQVIDDLDGDTVPAPASAWPACERLQRFDI